MTDMTLKTSVVTKLNDLNEGRVDNLYGELDFSKVYDLENYVSQHCYTLCFTQNYEPLPGYCVEGSNHPAMWAHYADNSSGVCIVIDKDEFIKANQDIFDKYTHFFENVDYQYINAPDIEKIDNSPVDAKAFIEANYRQLFFRKHSDWANEDEHRLLILEYDGKFSIKGCVCHIVMGRRLFSDEEKLKELVDIFVNPKYACYGLFNLHSFAEACYNRSGYITNECASRIQFAAETLAKERGLAENIYVDLLERDNLARNHDTL
jgi:hypothetical protein